jgi:chaperonin GroES
MIRPRNTKVIVERTEVKRMTESGIILAPSSEIKPVDGLIVAVGEEVEDLKKGDHVLFDKFATYQQLEGNQIILDEADILGVEE